MDEKRQDAGDTSMTGERLRRRKQNRIFWPLCLVAVLMSGPGVLLVDDPDATILGLPSLWGYIIIVWAVWLVLIWFACYRLRMNDTEAMDAYVREVEPDQD